MLKAGFHVSQHQLVGAIADTPISVVLDSCHKHLVTGTVRVAVLGQTGSLELRAGAVDYAEFGDLREQDALAVMRTLQVGSYQIYQRLPDLTGSLGSSAQFEGSVEDVSIIELMRHCEDNALSCRISVTHGDDSGELTYRAGEIVGVSFNGVADLDLIGDILRLKRAQFVVSSPPLHIGMEGWPTIAREPTAPFHVARGRHARGSSGPLARGGLAVGDEAPGVLTGRDRRLVPWLATAAAVVAFFASVYGVARLVLAPF